MSVVRGIVGRRKGGTMRARRTPGASASDEEPLPVVCADVGGRGVNIGGGGW